MLLRVDWEFYSITQVLGWQYFSPLLWLFVWFCATFWLCSGSLLEFGNPRGMIFPLTTFFCQELLCILHRKAYRTVVWGDYIFLFFNFFFYITFLQWFLVTRKGIEQSLIWHSPTLQKFGVNHVPLCVLVFLELIIPVCSQHILADMS